VGRVVRYLALMLRTVLLALGLLFATAAGADAATISSSSRDGFLGGLAGGQIWASYSAAPGEVNDLTIRRTGSDLVFTDSGAAITAHWPGNPCVLSPDAHTATCPTQGARTDVDVALGDGADTADLAVGNPGVEGVLSVVDGGAGNDEIVVEGGGTLRGGTGDDTLSIAATWTLSSAILGQDGADHITGGPATDLISGGPGTDVIDGAGGNDSVYDNSPDLQTDGEADELRGGAGNDQLYARGGVDTLEAGDGDDTIFAADAITAAGSSTAATPDVIDCGTGTDGVLLDAPDTTTACETLHVGCSGLTTTPWVLPIGPCPPPLVTGGDGGSGAAAAGAAPSPTPAPAPAPIAARPKPAPAPLTAKLKLSITRARPPLTVIPRGLLTLSATASVTITYARVVGSAEVALPGTIARRIAGGVEKNISLVSLLGGRQKFVPGVYRVKVAATAADGRTASATALIRMLTEKRTKKAASKAKRAPAAKTRKPG
jgi:hypothetical protein